MARDEATGEIDLRSRQRRHRIASEAVRQFAVGAQRADIDAVDLRDFAVAGERLADTGDDVFVDRRDLEDTTTRGRLPREESRIEWRQDTTVADLRGRPQSASGSTDSKRAEIETGSCQPKK